jgi:hypothetical protein
LIFAVAARFDAGWNRMFPLASGWPSISTLPETGTRSGLPSPQPTTNNNAKGATAAIARFLHGFQVSFIVLMLMDEKRLQWLGF